MVFPTIGMHLETGAVSQFYFWIVLFFSFALRFWKKTILIVVGVFLLFCAGKSAFAFNYVPGRCGSWCNANQQYYGQSWGNPSYFYPQLQYHSFYPPMMPTYFQPYPPSPYRPMWMNDCPSCNQNPTNNAWPQFYNPMMDMPLT